MEPALTGESSDTPLLGTIEGEAVVVVAGVPLPMTVTESAVPYYVESADRDRFILMILRTAILLEEKRLQIARTGDANDQLLSPNYSLKTHNHTLWTMCLSRIVDSFLVYLRDLLAAILRVKPETLKTSADVKVECVLQRSTMEEFILDLAQRRVERLTYEGSKEMVKYFERLGLTLFDTEDEEFRVRLAIESRNIIVHNRGVINEIFARRVPEDGGSAGTLISGTSYDVEEFGKFIDGLVARIDVRAAKKFGLPRIPFAQNLNSRRTVSEG